MSAKVCESLSKLQTHYIQPAIAAIPGDYCPGFSEAAGVINAFALKHSYEILQERKRFDRSQNRIDRANEQNIISLQMNLRKTEESLVASGLLTVVISVITYSSFGGPGLAVVGTLSVAKRLYHLSRSFFG